jgi:hypothetical protein
VFKTNDIKNDAEHQTMLFNQSVLEYAKSVSEYADAVEPWHDVHPAVRKLSRFKKALEDDDAKSPVKH